MGCHMTVLHTLGATVVSVQGKKVRSIHVTGHSLGGALASLCGYDLGQTIAEAVASEDGNFPTPTKVGNQTELGHALGLLGVLCYCCVSQHILMYCLPYAAMIPHCSVACSMCPGVGWLAHDPCDALHGH